MQVNLVTGNSMEYNYDPELQQAIKLIPEFDFTDPAAVRCIMEDLMEGFNAEIDQSGITICNRKIPGPDGAPEVPVRIYTPVTSSDNMAGLIYIHGGGFVVGSVDTEHARAVELCRDLGIVIVSVNYRLAPENPFPAGLEDCYATLCWMYESATSLNVDVERIGVNGGSAGGGLAAALALLTRDRRGPSLCFQSLAFPELDDRLKTYSMQAFTDTPVWNRGSAINSWRFYLGELYAPGEDNVPYLAAPARATVDQLKELPPAYVSTMEFDPLRDEGIIYAMNLMQAGVNVELHSYPGTFHGSGMLVKADVSRREYAELKLALRRGLGI